jgi:Tfp pilus assembly protein PilZ
LSEGGLFLESDVLKPIGTVLEFEFRVQDGSEAIKGKGVVRWLEEDPMRRKGMGIQFLDLNHVGREVITQLYREYKNNA